jgi:tetracycline repressor-like protein
LDVAARKIVELSNAFEPNPGRPHPHREDQRADAVVERATARVSASSQLPPHICEMTRELREEYVLYWRDLLEEARRQKIFRKVDLTMLRLVLFGAMNWAPQWYKPGEYSLAMIARAICDLIFNGAVDKERNVSSTTRRGPKRN